MAHDPYSPQTLHRHPWSLLTWQFMKARCQHFKLIYMCHFTSFFFSSLHCQFFLVYFVSSTPIILKKKKKKDDSLLDSAYDYDFTRQRDNGSAYYRGGKRYYRPYGWERFALKILDRYSDNKWIGKSGHRTGSSDGEWPVSYHGIYWHWRNW